MHLNARRATRRTGVATGLLVAAAVVTYLITGGTDAAAAPKQKQASHVVAVTNHRTSPVVSLAFFTDGDEKAPANMLKMPLKPGQTRKLTVSAKRDVCSFSVTGSYEDGVDIAGEGLDLCKDHVLALVD